MRTLFVLCLAASPAAAQDYLDRWFDRVNRDVQSMRAPFERSSGQPYTAMGIIGSYDTNLHLTEDDQEGQSIATVLIQTRMEYSDPKVDGAFDFLATWNQYIPDKEFSDDEERIYFRIRYGEPNGSIELGEIFRHESDPVDVQFADFAERYVSTTTPRAAFELGSIFGMEIGAQVGYVMFVEDEFKIQDNWSLRSDATVVAHVTQTVDVVAQGGWLMIDYLEDDYDVPGVEGWFARGGFRGQAWSGFLLTLLGGIAEIESEEFADGTIADDRVIDFSGHLQWEASKKLTFYLDATQQVAFLGVAGDPYEVVRRGVVSMEVAVSEPVVFRLRGQYDRTESALGVEREWIQGGVSIFYKDPGKWALDLSAVWRRSRDLEPVDYEADGWIFSLGILATN